MAHKEQRNNREKKKPKQDKNKKTIQQPASVFAQQAGKPKSVIPQPPQSKPGG